MKKIQLKFSPDTLRFPDDEQRIVDVFESKGYDISLDEARVLWEYRSSAVCAGWLVLPASDEEIWEETAPYWEEKEA